MPETNTTSTGLRLRWERTDGHWSAFVSGFKCSVFRGNHWTVEAGGNFREGEAGSLYNAQFAAESAARDLIKAAAIELGMECK